MNADKFFNTHSLEEISQKTKISPISLRFIRNKEFDKIPKVKFLGFIKIIENTYNVDLSDLIEEYNNQTDSNPTPKKTIQKLPPKKKENSNSPIFITIFALILIITGAFLLFKKTNNSTSIKSDKNLSIIHLMKVAQKNKEIEKNISIQKVSIPKEENISKNITKIPQKFPVTIIPKEKIWFKATNIDTNKSIEYLTTHKKILPKGNYYIKFGHGEFNLTYNNQTISPNTRKIVRILLKNGTYKFMKKPNRYEK